MNERKRNKMPWQDVMHKFKHGELKSGGPNGPGVKNRKQAIAIMLSEKKSSKSEYYTKDKKVRGLGGVASDSRKKK